MQTKELGISNLCVDILKAGNEIDNVAENNNQAMVEMQQVGKV